jgi:hypothetical protein
MGAILTRAADRAGSAVVDGAVLLAAGAGGRPKGRKKLARLMLDMTCHNR